MNEKDGSTLDGSSGDALHDALVFVVQKTGSKTTEQVWEELGVWVRRGCLCSSLAS